MKKKKEHRVYLPRVLGSGQVMTPADLKRLHKYMLEIEPPRKSSIPFDTWLTRISAILQIIAIPAAAYWAFTRFQAEDAPVVLVLAT
jgi:hypothetical protein